MKDETLIKTKFIFIKQDRRNKDFITILFKLMSNRQLYQRKVNFAEFSQYHTKTHLYNHGVG